MNTITIASKSAIKKSAVQSVLPSWTLHSTDCSSFVPAQPMGRTQIRDGAQNRLNQIDTLPAISLESGIIQQADDYYDITCVLLKTRFGLFEAWTKKLVLHNSDIIKQWLELPDCQEVTVGTLHNPFEPDNWYNRSEVMSEAVRDVCQQWRVAQQSLPMAVIPAPLKDFKQVSFLDIQTPLVENSRALTMSVRRLADRLLFDTIIVMDARGFLLCGEFAHEEYPIIMARKPGKLPNEELVVEYEKEYGTDKLCISKGVIRPGARVIVIDDLIATGGTMLAAAQLVEMAGGEVVAFIAPYAIEVDGKLLGQKLGPKMRFVCTQLEASSGQTHQIDLESAVTTDKFVALSPPSLQSLTSTVPNVPINWGRFRHSSNIWFDPTLIKDNTVYVFLDPSNYREMIDVLQVLSILYRKDPKKVVVVIPFMEQATQDRVEYNQEMESVAAVDTIGKLIGQHTVLTFDLHAEQSRFAFHDLRFSSLVEVLWEKYHLEHPDAVVVFPDEGAYKRFGRMKNVVNPVVFRKRRVGDKRIVATDDEVGAHNYVIVDDLVRSGGTMKSVANYLHDNGAKHVAALFAHAPLEPKACSNMKVFDDIWTSDSCPRLVPPEWVRVNVIDML